ncbi:hypothetical protein O6H91_01G021100 [Diphasiastrum complanatum]|nr:hypothetical protein O6H91_01G021100 [Diphasiastrum complanatum]
MAGFRFQILVAAACLIFPLLNSPRRIEAQGLWPGFYSLSCPNVQDIVTTTVKSHLRADNTVGAALLRLHFHDCFVQGCDGSVLIDGPSSEKNAGPNTGLRGFEVIDDAKTKLEAACPGVVSCADILSLAARDAVVQSGGPFWMVPLGRRDGTVSLIADAFGLPSPVDSVARIKDKFLQKGLSTGDMVALTGAHTIGQTDCAFFRYRLYNYNSSGNPDPTINTQYLATLQQKCPLGTSGSVRVALDKDSPSIFDEVFFKNVQQGNAVLESDQRIYQDMSTQFMVDMFAGFSGMSFKGSFISAMLKMSSIGVKTGTDGEIRKVCSKFNHL